MASSDAGSSTWNSWLQHGAVQVGAADALARRGAIQLGAAAAQVPGRVTAVPGVADLHHPAALAAADQPGQQRRALAGGAAAVPARRLEVGPQPGLDVLPGVPVQITGVMAGDQHLPLLLRQLPVPADHVARRVQALFGAGAAEHVRARIRRVGQEVVDCGIGRLGPGDAAAAGLAAGQQQPPLPQRRHHLPRRPELGEQGIDLADRRPDRLVVGQHDLPAVVVVQPDRQQLPQLPAGGLVPQRLGQPHPQHVELSLGHLPFKTQDQPVVEAAGMVDAVGVGDQRVGDRAQVQHLVPVGVVARQPGHLPADDDADLAQADRGDQVGEPEPSAGAGRRAGQVLIDHGDLLLAPAQLGRVPPQLVLQGQRLGVLLGLGQGGLADVDDRVPPPVRGGDLPVPRRRAPAHSSRPPPWSGAASALCAIIAASRASTRSRACSGSIFQRSSPPGSPRSRASWR